MSYYVVLTVSADICDERQSIDKLLVMFQVYWHRNSMSLI